jgi:hypothetical protein
MLTDAQKVDVRRWAGYPVSGDASVVVYSDPVYFHAGPRDGLNALTLDGRLSHLTESEETVLVDTYLTPIAALEAAILTVGDNLDTNKAAVWERNANEQSDRERLFKSVCRRMCAFLGVPPGPGLGSGNGISLVRA